MSRRTRFKFILSPDFAFPANRSPRLSSASSVESSELPFPFPPQESDEESSASSIYSFDSPFSIDRLFPPAASSLANSSSFADRIALSFNDPGESVSRRGFEPAVLNDEQTEYINAQVFSFTELATATENFRQEFLLGKGGFGHVYKGLLESTGQVVAVKKLDRSYFQGHREFLIEVQALSRLRHPNVVNLIGYCADGDHRLLVYEYMPLGSLRDHLHDLPPDSNPLDWNTRMKIVAGAAKGLEYLHDKARPSVIHKVLRSSSILLDEKYHPKLSNFGPPNLGLFSTCLVNGDIDVAPEYLKTSQHTMKRDVHSFGVVMLELITGRKLIDSTRERGERNLLELAAPFFKDGKSFHEMVDPLLQGLFTMGGLDQALKIAEYCLRVKEDIGEVVKRMTYLDSQTYERKTASAQTTPKRFLDR